jgi:hypothetical protein
MRLDIFGNDSAGAHKGSGSDGDSPHDDRPGADGRSAANAGWNALPIRVGLQFSVDSSVGIEVVDEHHAVADEDFILDRYTFADEGVAGDFAALPDDGILLDFYK